MLSIINENLVLIKNQPKNKNSILKEMVELLHKQKRINNKDKFFKEITEREKIQSTGIGENIAIPHAKSETVRLISVVIVICKNGINFKAVDNKPVKMIVMVAAPKDFTKIYLQIVAKIARILKNIKYRKKLLKAVTQKKVVDLIRDFDRAYPDRLKIKLNKTDNVLLKDLKNRG